MRLPLIVVGVEMHFVAMLVGHDSSLRPPILLLNVIVHDQRPLHSYLGDCLHCLRHLDRRADFI